MKKGFTLIELLVSIALFGLIALLMFGTIDNLRKQLTFYKEKERIIVQKNKILSLMRTDFDRPQSLTLSSTGNKDFNTAFIAGSNRSLYAVDRPHVVWIVLKENHTLTRLESPYPITLPLGPDAPYLVHSDVIGEECEFFRVYDSSKHRLVYVKFANEPPLMVETVK